MIFSCSVELICLFLFLAWFEQISVSLDGSNTVLANLTLPALPTSVVIGGLVTDEAYSIRAAAWTQIGMGPASDAQVHRMEAMVSSKTLHPGNPYGTEGSERGAGSDPSRDVTADIALVVQETWFILLLGGILLAILLLLIVALLVRRNLAKKKALSLALNKPNGMDDHTVINGSVRARDAFWSRGWSTAVAKDAEMDAQATLLPHLGTATHNNRTVVAPPEYAELLGHSTNDQGHLSLSSFMPRRNINNGDHPAAYATTTLVTQRTNASPYATSAAVVPGMMGHPASSDSSGYTTDELGDRSRRAPSGVGPGYLTKTQSRQTSNNNVKLPNLGQLFPPPPRHPPPSSPSLATDRCNEVPESFL